MTDRVEPIDGEEAAEAEDERSSKTVMVLGGRTDNQQALQQPVGWTTTAQQGEQVAASGPSGSSGMTEEPTATTQQPKQQAQQAAQLLGWPDGSNG